jgi:hypothetical protein
MQTTVSSHPSRRKRVMGKLFGLGVFMTVMLLLTAGSCGGGTTPAPDFSISVPDVAIAKLASGAANGSTVVTITRTGSFSTAVALSVTGAPAGVTTSFSEASTTGLSSTLNLTVADTTAAGASTLTVTGTAGSATKTDTFVLTVNNPPAPQQITVAGKVTDIFGGPLSSIAVKIGTQVANTNAQGQFSIPNVTTPYDVKVVQNTRGYLFKGLTRADPNLQLVDFGGFLGTKSATINSQLSGGAGFANPASHRTVVTFGAPEGFGSTTLNPAGGPAYTVNAQWSGNDVVNGNLHALQWEFNASNVPINYKGYVTKTQSLTNGGTINSPTADLALSAGVAQADLTGNVTVPSGYTLSGNRHHVDWGTNQSAFLFSNTATSFSYKTPNISNTMTITSIANNPAVGDVYASKTGIAPNATNVSLTLPEASALSLPITAATGITTTTSFNWTAFSSGVHIVFYSGGGRQYYVVTQANNTTIPDFSAEGLGLPAATNFNWQVVGMAPFASVDAATGPTGPLTDLFKTAIFGLTPEGDGSYMVSLTRTFTTAP